MKQIATSINVWHPKIQEALQNNSEDVHIHLSHS